MGSYYAELRALSEARKAGTRVLPEIEVFRIKKLYRKLARMLHPDLHPTLRGDPEALDLWQKIRLAYERNDYDALKESEVLAMARFGDGTQEIDVADAEAKIASLREEIAQIVREDPYLYKFLLSDEDAVENKKSELKKEIGDYRTYLEELKQEAEACRIEEEA